MLGSWRQIIAGESERSEKSSKGEVMERCCRMFHVTKVRGVS